MTATSHQNGVTKDTSTRKNVEGPGTMRSDVRRAAELAYDKDRQEFILSKMESTYQVEIVTLKEVCETEKAKAVEDAIEGLLSKNEGLCIQEQVAQKALEEAEKGAKDMQDRFDNLEKKHTKDIARLLKLVVNSKIEFTLRSKSLKPKPKTRAWSTPFREIVRLLDTELVGNTVSKDFALHGKLITDHNKTLQQVW